MIRASSRDIGGPSNVPELPDFADDVVTLLLSRPRTPPPNKPLPIIPFPFSSLLPNTIDDSTLSGPSLRVRPDSPFPFPPSPNSMDDSTLDSPSSLRDPTASPRPTPTLPAENISTGLPKRTHALLELIESERAYASDLALIRDIHLPVALGACFIFLFPSLITRKSPRQ